MNIRQSIENGDSKNLIDVTSTSIDSVSEFELSQPFINADSVISGGSHTSGMVQYAYGLYVLNGSQTTISPTSELVAIDKGPSQGGGEVNEQLGMSVVVNINNIDNEFTHIKLYSIKYTSYNQIPEILVVADKEIDNFNTFTFYDDGASTTSISVEEFIFLGSDPISPKHIVSNDNILFPVNVTEDPFEIDEIDFRIYGHNDSSTAVVWENVNVTASGNLVGSVTTLNSNYDLPDRHDAINKDYDVYKYQSDGNTLGAEGKYLKLEVVQNSNLNELQASEFQFLKDRELYRIGIVLYNRRGQSTSPKWMCDVKAPEGNLSGNYNQLKVELKPAFTTYINSLTGDPDNVPVGYKIVRADRTISDQTILTQGMINPMTANNPYRDKHINRTDRVEAVDSNTAIKMPSITRMFNTMYPFVGCKDYHELAWTEMSSNSFEDLKRSNKAEGFKSKSGDDFRAQTFQHSRLMQMFSPEAMFANLQIDASYKLKIIGLEKQSNVENWATETNPNTDDSNVQVKFIDGITAGTTGVTWNVIDGQSSFIADKSFYGPTNNKRTRATHQCYRVFKGDYKLSPNQNEYEMYGSPEITERGADFTTYNGDSKLRYANHLKEMMLDDWNESKEVTEDAEVHIIGMNTIGAKCITFAEGPDNSSFSVSNRTPIEDMWSDSGITEAYGVLIAEFVKDSNLLYVGNIYGGFTYEAKSVSSYIGIGEYTDINTTSVIINSPGDTFVQDFTFTKLVKDDTDIISRQYNIISEIVTVRVETQIDLKNRNDLSIGEWDNRWQPKYDEYQQYNRVYSQQPTLVTSISEGSIVKKIKEFDTRIMASKTKIPGEFIDSWTDFLINESMDLDGKYGPINAVVDSNDKVYVLQDTGVAYISINPRVQTTGSDGIQIELGTGGILNDYQYLSTNSGCLNKWGVISTASGFYYVDLLNRAIVRYNGKITGLTDEEGFHHEFNNVMLYEDLVIDNAVLGSGISCGYNSVNNEVYFTILQSKNSFTLAYNEATQSFTSYYDYMPAWYINKGPKMLSVSPTNNDLWEHFKGDRNSFYGVVYESSIEFHIAPKGQFDCTYNTAEFRFEITDSEGNDLPKEGLTSVRLRNEYQDSSDKELTTRSNAFKKNRNWYIKLPRDLDTRDRIKSPWAYMTLTLENNDGKKMVLHNVIVSYMEY
jgi:hypothetical protein